MVAIAKAALDTARPSAPASSGPRRPVRSDRPPIGTEVIRTDTPKMPNSSPMVVGDAPSRRLRSGSTGTAIEKARMSTTAVAVTRTTAVVREWRSDDTTGLVSGASASGN